MLVKQPTILTSRSIGAELSMNINFYQHYIPPEWKTNS